MKHSATPQKWYWVTAILLLVWNLIGVFQFYLEITNPDLLTADFTADQLAIFNNRPWWYMPNFGIAVIAGTLSCVLLLFKRRLAVALALISLIAVAISTFYEVIFSGMWPTLDGAGKGFMFFILFMDILLLLVARAAAARNWIR